MKKFLIIVCFLQTSMYCLSQSEYTFLQLSITGTTCYSNQERGMDLPQGLFVGFRSAAGVSFAVGRWVTPQVGLRLKLNGFGYKTVISDNGDTNSSRYAALFGDVMLNASNLFFGDSDTRRWEVAPYLGGGINRNFSYDEYGIGLRLGLQNSWRLTSRWKIHLDISYSVYEPDTDGIDPHEDIVPGESRHTLGNRDRSFGVEAGLTYVL